MILCNDRNEMWFISNQHFRVEMGERYSRSVYLRDLMPSAETPVNGNVFVS